MKLYHVSLDLGELNFIPRVPENRAVGEDDIVPRICLSDSIEGCLSAVPWGGGDLDEKVFSLSYDSSSVLIRVYEFDSEKIAEENLIAPNVLFEEDLVRDAVFNGEYWVKNQSIEPDTSYLIKLINYDEEVEDDVSYENLMLLEGENAEDLDYEDMVEGCFTLITNISYVIVAEEQRSKIYALNHKFKVLRSDYSVEKIIDNLIDEFGYSSQTWVEIDSENLVIKGCIDTRGHEIDREEIVSVLNDYVLQHIELVA